MRPLSTENRMCRPKSEGKTLGIYSNRTKDGRALEDDRFRVISLGSTVALDRSSLALEARIRGTAQWAAAVKAADRLVSTVRPRSAKDGRKFLRLDAWLAAIISRATILEIQNCNPLTILDLGTGTGLFPFVCQNLGHIASGLDLPGDLMRCPEREIFTQMPAVFGVTVTRFPIRAFTQIEGIGSYDLITGFLVNFNNH